MQDVMRRINLQMGGTMNETWLTPTEDLAVVRLQDGIDRFTPSRDVRPTRVEPFTVDDEPDPQAALGELLRKRARQCDADLIAVGEIREQVCPPGTFGANIRDVIQHYCYAALVRTTTDYLREDLLALSQGFSNCGANGYVSTQDVAGRALKRIDELKEALEAAGCWTADKETPPDAAGSALGLIRAQLRADAERSP